MEDHRYYIAIDENGQPYIEHGLLDTAKNAGQRSVKYLMKIGEGAQARYLYTQQEVQAYMNRAQRAAEAQRNKAAREAARLRAEAERRAAKAKDAGQKAVNTAKNTAQNAASKARSAGQKAVDTVKDKIGVDERQRALEADKRLNEEYKKSGNKRTEAFDKAANESAKADSEYRNTVLGKAETALNTVTKPARRAISKLDDKVDASAKFRDEQGNEISAKEAGRRAGEAAKKGFKSTTERMKDEFRKLKDDIPDKLGVDERKRLKESEDYRDRTMNLARRDNVIKRTPDGSIDFSENAKQQEAAQKDVDSRRDEYYNTPMGKVAKLKDDAENAVDEAKRKTDKKVNDVKEQLKETFDKIERERDFKNAPKSFKKLIETNAKNKGITEEEAAKQLHDYMRNDHGSYESDPEMYKAYSSAIDEAMDMINKEKSKKEDRKAAVDKVKDKAGVDERENRDQAQKEYDSAKRSADRMRETANQRLDDVSKTNDREEVRDNVRRYSSLKNSADKMETEAENKLKKAQSAYDETPLGKAEKAVGTVKDAAKNGAKGLKDTTERMKDEFRKLQDNVTDTVKDKAGIDERERRDEAQRQLESAKRVKERMDKRADELSKEIANEEDSKKRGNLKEREENLRYHRDNNERYYKNEKLVREAENDLSKAQRAYDRTLLGTAENSKNAVKSIPDKVSKAVDDLKESTGAPAKKRLAESKEAYDKANEEWEKAYEKAVKAQEKRQELEWEKDKNGNWRKRELTEYGQRELKAAKAAENVAADILDRATKKVQKAGDAYAQDYEAYRDTPMNTIDNALDKIRKKK